MTVFVDNFDWRRDDDYWCHLMADTHAELDRFARRHALGPVRVSPSGVYVDVNRAAKARALAEGAMPIPCWGETWWRVVHAGQTVGKNLIQ